MKASELIGNLTDLRNRHGDLDVCVETMFIDDERNMRTITSYSVDTFVLVVDRGPSQQKRLVIEATPAGEKKDDEGTRKNRIKLEDESLT